ncbi:MAG TPA: hypothetical protein VKK81_11590, partial [Candidatus Binatia bacterium]|nr:hypothetical protein [Candidatus Binatia bacterium]
PEVKGGEISSVETLMKPPPFAYHDPTSIEEALNLLQHYGGDAKVLAGGQSLAAVELPLELSNCLGGH